MAFYNPLVKPKHEVSRNAFDLSQRRLLTAKPGQLIPCLTIDCVPNDYIEVDLANLTKTMPVNSDAFVRASQNFEFFYVPYSLLWRDWYKFITLNNSDEFSTRDGRYGGFTPHFELDQLFRALSNVNDPEDQFGIPRTANALRLLEQLGYGNFRPLNENENYGSGSSQFALSPNGIQNKLVNPFRIAAYNKIWYDYYRNKSYDTEANLVYSWNFDYVGTGNQINIDSFNIVPNSGLEHLLVGARYSLFEMKYRQWKKDLFTSLMPSAQFGAVSSVDLSAVHIKATTAPNTSTNATVGGVATPNNVGNLYVGNSNTWNIPAGFDVYALKRAEVLQKWKEDTLRAGQSAKSQLRAHFGGRDSEYLSASTCEFLGSCSSPIEINPIYSTAETDGAPLGEIAGRGQSVASGKKIKFQCPNDFGILMCIYSIVPESDYDATGIDVGNTLIEPSDFFSPDFDNLGLEAVFGHQVSVIGQLGDDYMPHYKDVVLGYAPRFSYLKTAVDKITGEFSSVPDTLQKFRDGLSGSLSNWTIPRPDIVYYGSGGLQLTQLYIDPLCDKTIFNQTDEFETSDHYLIDVYFDVSAVRQMSKLGLPQW